MGEQIKLHQHEPIVFTIGNEPRLKSFENLIKSFFTHRFGSYVLEATVTQKGNSMFQFLTPKAPEPTDNPKGDAEQFITAVPGTAINVKLGDSPARSFIVPEGKRAKRIKYTYEIELEDLPKCDECNGTGQLTLFTTIETCGGCNGSGYKRT